MASESVIQRIGSLLHFRFSLNRSTRIWTLQQDPEKIRVDDDLDIDTLEVIFDDVILQQQRRICLIHINLSNYDTHSNCESKKINTHFSKVSMEVFNTYIFDFEQILYQPSSPVDFTPPSLIQGFRLEDPAIYAQTRPGAADLANSNLVEFIFCT